MRTAPWGWTTNGRNAREPRPPSRLLWLAEYRAFWEISFALLVLPLLMTAPRGDGHPVLALPGFLSSDQSTAMLRSYLNVLGYSTFGWELGRNLGGIARMRARLRARLAEVHEKTGRTVSLVGWSLGGIYARDLALAMPALVRSVITVGSPFTPNPSSSNISDIYHRITGEAPWDEESILLGFGAIGGDLPMPSTSIYSKVDGVINWRSTQLATNERTENVEVLGASHVGLGANAAVMWAIADRLAQSEGTFTPFARGGPFTLAYGR